MRTVTWPHPKLRIWGAWYPHGGFLMGSEGDRVCVSGVSYVFGTWYYGWVSFGNAGCQKHRKHGLSVAACSIRESGRRKKRECLYQKSSQGIICFPQINKWIIHSISRERRPIWHSGRWLQQNYKSWDLVSAVGSKSLWDWLRLTHRKQYMECIRSTHNIKHEVWLQTSSNDEELFSHQSR